MVITIQITGNPVINPDSAYVPTIDSEGNVHNVPFTPPTDGSDPTVIIDAAVQAFADELQSLENTSETGKTFTGNG